MAYDYGNGVQLLEDLVVDESDKALFPTISVGHRLLYGVITFAASSQAGDRSIRFDVRDAGGAIMYGITSPVVQAEDLTRQYLLAPNGTREAAFVGTAITLPLPPEMVILPGWNFHIFDVADIDDGVDDMTVRVMLANLNHVR